LFLFFYFLFFKKVFIQSFVFICEVKMKAKVLGNIANTLRRDSLRMTTAAGSGHPTSCLSCAEIMSVLFFDEMKWDPGNSENKDNDEFILSKGHAAPILYSALFHAGAIKENLMSLRKLHSKLEGHPVPRSLPWVKAATGSLGQGLSVGVGMALAGKKQNRGFRTFVLLGDSEMAEGSNYEALQLASYYNLDNLVAVIDANRLGQRGKTMVGHHVDTYAERLKSFGWYVEVVDGHNVKKLQRAFSRIAKAGKPGAVIAKTFKGKGVSFLENRENWHGKALSEEELHAALREVPEHAMPHVEIQRPREMKGRVVSCTPRGEHSYSLGDKVATREAYGFELVDLLAGNENVLAVDAEVSNSTHAEEVKKICPEKFVETFISEQNMAGICLGLSKKGFNVFGSTFAAFLTRAHDQIRMAALSSADFTLCGSHAGVSIGEDGASQMGLEDISMFRALPESVVLYPADAIATEKLVRLAAKTRGLKYIRTTRGKTDVIYNRGENFELGEFKVLRQSRKDKVVLVGAGITLYECLKAWEKLGRKIPAAVVDLYCVKPFNGKKFASFVAKHGGKVIVCEDHRPEGGIGEMVAGVLAGTGIEIDHLAVREIPHSGKPEELLEKYKIDSEVIVKAVKKIV
jgi:transketolase